MSRVAPLLIAAAVAAGPMLPPAASAEVTDIQLVEGFLRRAGARARADLVAARREAAEQSRAQAPAWTLHVRREGTSSDPGAYTTDVIGAGVSIDLASVNGLERSRAAAAAEASRLAMRAELADAASDVRLLALQAWQAQSEAALRVEAHASLERLVAELEGLVAGGEHSRFDLLRLRELARAHGRRAATAAAAADSMRARVSSLCGLSVDGVGVGPWADVPLTDSLRALALQGHPQLQALRLQSEAAASALAIASRSHAASLDVSGGHRTDDEPGLPSRDGYEIEVGVTLPRLSMRRAAVAEARASQAGADLALSRAEILVASAIDAAMEELRLLRASTRESGSAADELRDGAMARYRAGESDLTELVEVLGSLQERALLEIEVESAVRRARIELDRATSLMTAPEIALLLEGPVE